MARKVGASFIISNCFAVNNYVPSWNRLINNPMKITPVKVIYRYTKITIYDIKLRYSFQRCINNVREAVFHIPKKFVIVSRSTTHSEGPHAHKIGLVK